MKVRNLCILALGAAAITGLPPGPVYAGDQYQATIVVDDSNTTTAFKIAKPGSKVIIKPSSKPGDGGVLVQLILKNVDCPTIDNDLGKVNKCGSKAAADPRTRKHVLNIGARALGLDTPDVAGVTYRLVKGAAAFEATGKNTISAAQAFGVLAGPIAGHALGVGLVKLQERGTDPDNATTGCSVVPLPLGNTCIDGGVYGIAGITVP